MTDHEGAEMQVTLPTDCGNAPRIGIVGDFTVDWAAADTEAVSAWLADSVVWTVVGGGSFTGADAAREARAPFVPERIEVLSIITHGRLASCDGYLEAGGSRLDFSHFFRFASTSKAAKIAEIRSYLIEA